MKCAEYSNLESMLFRPLQQCVCRQREQVIKQCRICFEEWPEFARHGERDVLMLTVRHDIKLGVYPLLGGFSATRAASLRLAALTDNLSMRAVWSAAVVVFGTHQVAATCEHAFNASDLPEAKSLSMFPQYLFPSVVLFE